ncbi:MAG: DUF2029 domain-containing protein [Acidobacteriota bacterium]|nr:DUF2029 domain-containing protein [Acidobacteriota bacterium]
MKRQTIVAMAILAVSLAALYWVAWRVSAAAPPLDLRAFWASARLLRTAPYDRAAVAAVQQALPGGASHGRASQDMASRDVLMMRNPPWVLPLVWPLGLLSYPAASAWMLLLNLCLVLGCAVWLWLQFGGGDYLEPLAAGMTFAPAVWLLRTGQLTALLLLGLALLLWGLRRQRDMAAGIGLALLSLKPHLVLPLLLVVALQAARQRRHALLVVPLGVVAVLSGVVFWANPGVGAQYVHLMTTLHQENYFYHSLGSWLELETGSRALGMVPTLVGLAVTGVWWRRRRALPLAALLPGLVLLSIASSYYVFDYDHVLLLVPVLAGLRSSRWRWVLAAGGLMNVFVWVQAVYGARLGLPQTLPAWEGLGWLLACLPVLQPELEADRPVASAEAALG